MKVNGKSYDRNYITYPMLMDGARIDLDMASKPDTVRGTDPSAFPYSFTNELKSN